MDGRLSGWVVASWEVFAVKSVVKLCLLLVVALVLCPMTVGCGASQISEDEARQQAGDDTEKEVPDGPAKPGRGDDEE